MSIRLLLGIFTALLLISKQTSAQKIVLRGQVLQLSNKLPLSAVKIHLKHTRLHTKTDEYGNFRFEPLDSGRYELTFYKESFSTLHRKLYLKKDTSIALYMDSLSYELSEVQVEAQGAGVSNMEKLKTVEGTAIYEGKKNEVIVMKEMTANLATNNARQVFAKVPGLNIWENDNAGLQLGIGTRGLSPNRTSNFNVRQNGYDISADALGYPESYYTPPLEAVERIEVVRGAASLQYGTQFGGLLNFKMKQGGNKPLEVTTRQTLGSFGLFNSFNSLGGSKGEFRYYGFFQHKQGGGWRDYSNFNLNMGYGAVSYSPTEKITITTEYTGMNYLTQMPGGLTDKDFNTNPQQVLRKRNWFKVNWNLFALHADYKISPRTHLNTRFFGIYSGREALGNLNRITDKDDSTVNRNLLADTYFNLGNETRLLHRYMIGKQGQVFVLGFRAYRGTTKRKQGEANTSNKPDFYYLHPDSLENSDYTFPGQNYALFAEHAFFIKNKLSITPGVRFEYIRTDASGYYTFKPTDNAGNVLLDTKIYENRTRERNFMLFGLGVSYKHKEWLEGYANFSQNYRAITFSDIRVVNPNYKVNPNIQDEKGYNADLGARGTYKNFIQYDISLYYMFYNGRIGDLAKIDSTTYQSYRYHTNVADSRTYGVEAFTEIDACKLAYRKSTLGIPLYTSLSLNDARYIHSQDKGIQNKYVELVPKMMLRLGAGIKWKDLRINYQYSYVSQQFTDASNAPKDPYAVLGIIPAYYVADLSAKYTYEFATLETGVNNLTNNIYFTRRAEGYPGPGIIPSAGRSWYVTLGLKF